VLVVGWCSSSWRCPLALLLALTLLFSNGTLAVRCPFCADVIGECEVMSCAVRPCHATTVFAVVAVCLLSLLLVAAAAAVWVRRNCTEGAVGASAVLILALAVCWCCCDGVGLGLDLLLLFVVVVANRTTINDRPIVFGASFTRLSNRLE